jgi:oleate hydratase
MVDGFDRLRGVMRTVYNQYDSRVRPLHERLRERGVKLEMNTRVTDLGFVANGTSKTVERVVFQRPGAEGAIIVGPRDYVLVTVGSMTKASRLGSMDAAPMLGTKHDGGA